MKITDRHRYERPACTVVHVGLDENISEDTTIPFSPGDASDSDKVKEEMDFGLDDMEGGEATSPATSPDLWQKGW